MPSWITRRVGDEITARRYMSRIAGKATNCCTGASAFGSRCSRLHLVANWWKDDSRRDLPGLSSVLSALVGDRVQSPLARDAFELVQSSVIEADSRPGYEIPDRA